MANLKLSTNPNNNGWEELTNTVHELVQSAGFGSTGLTKEETNAVKYGVILDRSTSRKGADWRQLYHELVNILRNTPATNHWNLTLRGKPITEINAPEYAHLPLNHTIKGNITLSASSAYPETEHRAYGKINNWKRDNKNETLDHPMFLQHGTTMYGKVLLEKDKYTIADVLEKVTRGKILAADLEQAKTWTHHHHANTRINNEQILGIPGTVTFTQLELATISTLGINIQTNEKDPRKTPWRSHLDVGGDTLIQIDDLLRGTLWGI